MDLKKRASSKILLPFFAAVASDTPFRSWCRLKQSIFRHDRGWKCGAYVGKEGGEPVPMGNYLTEEDADAGINFLNPEIFQLAKERLRPENREHGEVIEASRLCRNMLTSQTMCFNLFLPQATDLALATTIWKTLMPNRVAEVKGVKLEHSPGRGDANLGTGDHSAFDAFVEYVHCDGAPGFLAIETKYTESFSGKGSKPDGRLEGLSTRLFTPESWERVKLMSTQQLWRTHLLAETMRGDHYEQVTYLVLHAEGDKECVDVLPEYKVALSHHSNLHDRFECMTLESLIGKVMPRLSAINAQWLNNFWARYLDWGPVDRILAEIPST